MNNNGTIDMVSLIMTAAIAAITLMVGLVVMQNVTKAMATDTTMQTNLNTTMYQLTDTIGTGFNVMAIGLIIAAAAGIIYVTSALMGSHSHHYEPTNTPGQISEQIEEQAAGTDWQSAYANQHATYEPPATKPAKSDEPIEIPEHKKRKYELINKD